ncbi:Exoribonuclease phosphorolytic domain 2 [Penicillium riverlandense]|uniref:Exoribonuclease phosphorolytic domain 2 n=1 Tax=Penicillium riverlandense TaxID=1903569 RepID=UPI002547E6D5|nr:Exoribonuclease phosphorolytic domain 2 [Penicillium riverlandense]KAJ5819956.1 Exoribonuclease phosphorolytic domain 2 [Penicillium riverlandense]
MVGPTASLAPLHRADGSSSYTCPATGYELLGAVNAPVELPARRDALKPEEATVEVFVKPGTTTAGVGERYVEGILRSVLATVILGREKGLPQRGVVITLAIVGGENVERGDSYLTLLPALLHTSLLALLSAAVPLSMTFSATLLGVTKSGIIIPDPSPADAKAMASLHALAFSSKGHLLLNESQGRFEFDTWEAVRQTALGICHNAAVSADGDVSMGEGAESAQLHGFVRETVEDQVHRDYAWKMDAV